LPAPAVAAVDTDQARLEAQKEQLFGRMLKDPANLDVAFAYADVSARLGDYEAAVSALERMLLFNPNLPRVQLELGALYFRMGSYELARTYFEKAASASPPPEVVARVNQYLAEIEKGESRHHLTGYVFFGVQAQSDANVAPGSPLIQSPVGPVLLNSQFVKSSDKNIFGAVSALYSYDLGNQNRDTIEVTGTTFANHYFKFRRLDLDLFETTAGPRFNLPSGFGLGSGVNSASVKPYVIANEVLLGENQYFNSIGAGVEYSEVVWSDLQVRSSVEFRQKYFTNAPDRPLSTGLNGNDTLVSLVATKPVTDNSAASVQFDFLNQSTQLNYFANKTYSLTGAYRVRYDDPIGLTPNPWETTFVVSHSWANYEGPDPCCVTGVNAFGQQTFSNRSDRHWRFGLTHAFVVSPNTAILVQLQRDVVSSNLPLYAYTSNSIVIGPQIRF
jgi:hypothetical protein